MAKAANKTTKKTTKKTATKAQRARFIEIDGLRINSLAEAGDIIVKLRDGLAAGAKQYADANCKTQAALRELAAAKQDKFLIQYMIRDWALALDRMGIGLNIRMPYVVFRANGADVKAHVSEVLRQGMLTYIEMCKKLPPQPGDITHTFEGQEIDLGALAEGRPQPSPKEQAAQRFMCLIELGGKALDEAARKHGWKRWVSDNTPDAEAEKIRTE